VCVAGATRGGSVHCRVSVRAREQ